MSHAAPRPRLAGVDTARGVALLGMVAVHVASPMDAAGGADVFHLVFSGVASVLFVLLAGVGLALLTGGAEGLDTDRLPALRPGVARRAGLLFLIGLACGWLGAPVAVILCHYALLFLLALPFLGLRARTLAVIAGAWILAGPVLVFALQAAGQALLGRDRFLLGARLWVSPAPEHLLDPALLLTDLLLTGYYPVLSWMGFLLLGLALGRMRLEDPRLAVRLTVGGALAWGALTLVGAQLRAWPALLERIAAATGAAPEELALVLRTGGLPLEPLIPDLLWLAVVAPHSGSVLEAVRAAGWACAVLGVCLLVFRPRGAAPGRSGVVDAVAAPLLGAGRSTLSLYVGHLVVIAALLGTGVELGTGAGVVGLWALCLAAGWAVWISGRRGPLEAAVAALSRGRS